MTNSSSQIEHFLILGIKNLPSEVKYETFSTNSIEVGLIDCFPKIDSLPDYLEHINLWCFPDGYQVYDSYRNVINNGDLIKSRGSKPSPTIREEMGNFSMISHFILTDQDYIKRYCSALIFYEKCELVDNYPGFNQSKTTVTVDKNIVFCPKVLCIISLFSILEIHKQILNFIFENVIKPKHFQYMPIKPPTTPIPKKLFRSFQEYQTSYGKERGESLFYEKFNEIISERSNSQTDCDISETDYIEFYLSFFYDCLPTNSPPEDYSVLIEGFSSEKPPILKYNISKNQNLYEHYFKTLFTKMQFNNILKLIKFCLMEKSIIIFSSNPNDIIAITESLLALINPLKWTCIYAPILPIMMIQILQAVIPYLVGMNSKHKETVISTIDLSDKVIVDLDEDTISCQEDTIFLPKTAVERITRKLSKIIKKLHSSNISEKDLLEYSFQIKASFSDFMLGLINNYVPFFLFSRDFNDKTVISSEIFDQTSYSKIFPQEDWAFVHDFTTKTMMFNKFLEDSYKLLYFLDFLKKDIIPAGFEETNLFICLLKKILKALSKNGKFEGFIDLESLQHLQRLIDLDKDLRLQLAMENYSKPKSLKILQYFIKYYQSLGDDQFQKKSKSDNFVLLKGFNPNLFLILSNKNIKSMNQMNVFRDKAPIEDDLIEFTSINLPTNPMVFPRKNLEIISTGQEQESKNGFIEAILLKEMEICMLKEKSRRKTIFSAEENLKHKNILQNMEYGEILNQKARDINQKLIVPPLLTLKKAQSEQPNSNKSINYFSSKKNEEDLGSKSSTQNPKSFQMFTNKNRSQKNRDEEEGTRKIPIMNVNNGKKDTNQENQEFSIFSYLISDLLKEDENKLAVFPIKPKGFKDTIGQPPLQLRKQLTTGPPEKTNKDLFRSNEKVSRKDHSFLNVQEIVKSYDNSIKPPESIKAHEFQKTKDNSFIDIQEFNKSYDNSLKPPESLKAQDFIHGKDNMKFQENSFSKGFEKNLKYHEILENTNNDYMKKNKEFKKTNEIMKSQEIPKHNDTQKVQDKSIGIIKTIKNSNEVKKLPNDKKSNDLIKFQDNIKFNKNSSGGGYLENVVHNKTPKKETGIFPYQEKKPLKEQIKPQDKFEFNEKISFLGKGYGKQLSKEEIDKKALKEMTNMTLNVNLEASSYDYNCRLLKKKSFLL